MKFLIVTGLSGAGKTSVLRHLEDSGYQCMDNIPPLLLAPAFTLCEKVELDTPVALGVDSRSGALFDADAVCSAIDQGGDSHEISILFLEADTETLIDRYKETRRDHPLMRGGMTLEQAIAKGALPEGALNSVRETLATTLSALGDSFFSGTLLPLWSLLSISLLLAGFTNIAMLLAVILFGSLLLFRSICFVSGLRYGLTTLARLRKLNLINWVDRLKMVNAALAALVIWHLPISTMKPFPWTAYAMGAAAVLAAAWLVGRMRLPRLLLWVVTTGALILVDLGFIGM